MKAIFFGQHASNPSCCKGNPSAAADRPPAIRILNIILPTLLFFSLVIVFSHVSLADQGYTDSKGRTWIIKSESTGKTRIRTEYLPFLPFWVYDMIRERGDVDTEWYNYPESINLYVNENGEWKLKIRNLFPENSFNSEPREGPDGCYYMLYGRYSIFKKPLHLLKINKNFKKSSRPLRIFGNWSFSGSDFSLEILPNGDKVIFYTKYLEVVDRKTREVIFYRVLRKNFFLTEPEIIVDGTSNLSNITTERQDRIIKLTYSVDEIPMERNFDIALFEK